MADSRRLRRRLKNLLLAPEPIYRLYLRAKFGSNSVARLPVWPIPSGALQTEAEWQYALSLGREHHLPLHRGLEKNWDHLAAIFTLLESTPPPARILDAGAELYSNVLPALFLAGYRDLYGLNLAFTDKARRGPIRYEPGDLTASRFPDGFFDAVTCLSVIEHGVPLAAYFREMHRILRPGGLLITSTDYYPTPINTHGQSAHGAPVKIFTRPEIESFLDLALASGFDLTSPVNLDCSQRPVYWREVDLRYTFLFFTLQKR